MFDFLLFTVREGAILLAGAFIGWNVPRPQWAKDLQAKAIELYGKAKAAVKAKFAK